MISIKLLILIIIATFLICSACGIFISMLFAKFEHAETDGVSDDIAGSAARNTRPASSAHGRENGENKTDPEFCPQCGMEVENYHCTFCDQRGV